MDQLVSAIAQHGYGILFAFVFLEVIGLPVPAAPLMIIAGGASANGVLNPLQTILTALSAMLLGDAIMFLIGRFTGWWLLGVLCRLSLSPESCILRSADAFYKKGRAVLIFAKFVPGISALAVPLAGSMKMRIPQFIAFDCAGALLYTLAYWSVGYICSGFVGPIVGGYNRVGGFLVWGVAVPVTLYVAYRIVVLARERKHDTVRRVTPFDVQKLGDVALFDVRSHGYYEKGSMRILGSSRLEPNGVHQNIVELPRQKELVLYCTCAREATSIKVAHALTEQGFRVSVIRGGLRAWKKAGLPLEPVPADDMVQLPTFS
jgi:membrane protein DedA with SNARE-associated domain/rhodanese-related sulfurtransferase